MAALRAVGDPMELRARELTARPRAVSDARTFLAQVRPAQLRYRVPMPCRKRGIPLKTER